jgi:uncharacterized membrane protein (UPF0127 family)
VYAILLTVLILVLLAFTYHCGIQKVCKFAFIERIVRHEKQISVPKGKLFVEVVDTKESREQGLSGRTGLMDDEGMLFVFDVPGRYGFWMKDMLFPLDLVWINQDGVVVHIERNATPESYFNFKPPHTFVNGPDAKYVLEIKAGTTDMYGLYLGTKVTIPE